jgi:hypothetical protein
MMERFAAGIGDPSKRGEVLDTLRSGGVVVAPPLVDA